MTLAGAKNPHVIGHKYILIPLNPMNNIELKTSDEFLAQQLSRYKNK